MSDPIVDFFTNYEAARPIFDALREMIETLGPVGLRVGKSQVSFRRRTGFAWAWLPDRYLGPGHAPLVLSVALRRRDASPRWKEIVEPAAGRFMHHLELRAPDEIDADVRRWLAEAYTDAA
ncbi:MAG: hypothetical protein KBG73_00540 [Candidatus Promineofilum sp.]|jgi:hypothetical protein|nr:hypothetical protein [Promineifilum sp.]